jgi:benzoyl-CoA 2,3-dioxygenase component B
MVYLLQKYFGRDGQAEADDLLRRQSGNEERPRMLGAFNEKTPDWLSFFMFTYFTDRDGKMQLEALAQSGFDPLSRTCRFMLAEEAHHMYVGYTGVMRIVEATAKAMAQAGIADPYDVESVRSLDVIDLPSIQRKVNLHYSLTLDLFGSEESTNAANFFNAGLKGRYHENRLDDDHQLRDASYPVMKLVDGELQLVDVPALNGLNARLRDDFIDDCMGGINRWNKEIESHGIEFEITLPHVAFNRGIGEFADLWVTPDGLVVTEEEFEAARQHWLPTGDDREYIESLMQPQYELGEFAPWIAPPTRGIDQKPTDFEYVMLP